jgi:parvulin-like peptidyl-prolyl isomerase
MRPRLQLVLVFLAVATASAQVVDRMVAVVNKRVIMQSELDQETRLECLFQSKPIQTLASTDRAATLERLVDRSLLEQQISQQADLDPDSDELKNALDDFRKQIPQGATEDGWKALLTSYGVTQQDVEEHLALQMRLLRFVDLRFRGLVRVDKAAIESYYQEKFVPEMRQRGMPEPPLSEVSGKIEKVLVEQRLDDMLSRWLEALRAQAHIQRMLPPAATVAGGVRQ